MIDQFTYTATPWGAGGVGWMVFQKTQSVNDNCAKALYQSFKYEVEIDTANEGGTHPVQFVYHAGLNGIGVVMSQTAFVGKRWWGEERPGDFFAHVLLADEKALCSRDFNPICYYQSVDLQTAVPDTLQKKALQIYAHEIPYTSPPPLDQYDAFGDGQIKPRCNANFSFEAVLERTGKPTILKIGAIVERLIAHKTGTPALVFDSSKSVSLDVMALALHLCPVKHRRHLWFATSFGESALKQLPDFRQFAFYGTLRKNTMSDNDTGLFEQPNAQALKFQTEDDIRAFKKFLDGCGEGLDASDFDKLVDCWRMLACGPESVDLLRGAGDFIKKYKQIIPYIEEALSRCSGYMTGENKSLLFKLQCIARYDLKIIASDLYLCFDSMISADATGLLIDALKCLSIDAREWLLRDLYEYAKQKKLLVKLANVYLSLQVKPECRSLEGINSNPFYERVELFKTLKNGEREFGQNDIEKVKELYDEVGDSLDGMSKVITEMEYGEELGKLKSSDDIGHIKIINNLTTFLSKFNPSRGVSADQIERDVLGRIQSLFKSMPSKKIHQIICLFDKYGLSGEQVLDAVFKVQQEQSQIILKDKISGEKVKWNVELKEIIDATKARCWFSGFITAILIGCVIWGARRWIFTDNQHRTTVERSGWGMLENAKPSLENAKEKKKPNSTKEASFVVRDKVTNGDTDNSKDKQGIKIETSKKETVSEEAK